MIVVDKLCYGSKLRYVNPYEKFAFAMLTLIFCIVSRSIVMGIFVMGVNALLTIKKGGISGNRYFKLMTIPLAFLVLSTVAIIVNWSREPLDAFALQIGEHYITGSCEDAVMALRLIVTALAAVSCLYFLSLNTTMTDILAVFRSLKCPVLISELMLMIYRFIFVLLDSAYYISSSQHARLGYKDYKTSLKSFAGMVQAVFIQSMKRSRVLYDAMEARCYDGRVNVLNEHRPVKRKNVIMIAVFEIVLLIFNVMVKTGVI